MTLDTAIQDTHTPVATPSAPAAHPRPSPEAAQKPARADTAVIRDWLLPRSAFTREMGTEVIRCGDGEAELALTMRPDLTQHHGTLHGGVVFTMMDNVACWAGASVAGDLVSVGMTVNFLAPGRGDRFTATARVVSSGKRMVVAMTEAWAIRDGERRLIATGVCTMLPTDAAAVRA